MEGSGGSFRKSRNTMGAASFLIQMMTLIVLTPSNLAANTVESFFSAGQKECPDFVDPSIFYYSSKVPYGSRNRAYLTVPEEFQIKMSLIPEADMGAFSRAFIPRHTWLGEYEGEFVAFNHSHSPEHACSSRLKYAWSVFIGKRMAYHVDAQNIRTSNWLRFVNCARHVTEQNVEMSMCYGRVYYRTVRDIAPGQELLVYYGPQYALTLGIDACNYYNRNANVKLIYDYPQT